MNSKTMTLVHRTPVVENSPVVLCFVTVSNTEHKRNMKVFHKVYLNMTTAASVIKAWRLYLSKNCAKSSLVLDSENDDFRGQMRFMDCDEDATCWGTCWTDTLVTVGYMKDYYNNPQDVSMNMLPMTKEEFFGYADENYVKKVLQELKRGTAVKMYENPLN